VFFVENLVTLRPNPSGPKILRITAPELIHRSLQVGGRKVEGAMQTYETLVELARICLKQAIEAENQNVRIELMHVAKGYQLRAAVMNKGKLPEIGEATAA
jgi:hypothetical protein